MAEFAGDMPSFKPSSLPFLELDPNMELIDQFSELNTYFLGNSTLCFSNENFLAQQQPRLQPELPISFFNNLQGNSQFTCTNSVPFDHSLGSTDVHHASKEQKVNLISGTSSGDCLAPAVENGGNRNNRVKRKNNLGRGKRGRNNERDVQKPKEVIHVRARRGQATDSHSLAERVRREKINEKLRCLQDLVPGCYKTMGMAVMLDEIITYVQSLQNQVGFLSMKLTTASSFYDFNSDTDVVAQTMQGTNSYEAQEVERLERGGEGYGITTCFHSTWAL